MVAHIGGIGTIHEVGAPRLVDTFVKWIGSSMGMISAITAVGHEVAVVLQHVQMVIRDHALDFMLRPLLGFRQLPGQSSVL